MPLTAICRDFAESCENALDHAGIQQRIGIDLDGNVVAHSMGNRPITAVMRQIGWQMKGQDPPLFDRIVLAAPDVVANQVTLYASSSDQALIASKQIHGYPRAGESGSLMVVVPGVETIMARRQGKLIYWQLAQRPETLLGAIAR